MADKELDELFRRFVREHDVGAIGDLFDAAAPQLARIAWHLTHDASGVDDLVQMTFLTALASTRESDGERRVMPWLLRILVNHARNARRAAERKPEPLDADVADARRPESELEQREIREVVERAVADLPDTYREVVSTWLIEGATPTEIAQRTGKPAATVRVQLRRGLELLRNGLPAGVAGVLASSGWSASSFAASRELVLDQAARMVRTLTPTSAVVAGGLLMTSKWLLIGAAALVTAAGVGWLVHSNGVQPTAVASAPIVSANELIAPSEVPAAGTTTAERSEVAAQQPAPAVEAAKSPAPGWWLIGEVEGVSPNDAAQLSSPPNEMWSAQVVGPHFEIDLARLFATTDLGARIDRLRGVEPRDSNQPASNDHDAAADLRTRLRAKLGPAPKSFVLRYDQARFMPIHVVVDVDAQLATTATAASERVELHVQIAPQPATLVVEGRVIATAELALSEVVAVLYTIDSRGNLEDPPTEIARCAKDGAFRARCASSGAHALAIVVPAMRPTTRKLAADARGLVNLGDVRLERGEHLAGVVVAVDAAAGVRASVVEARMVGVPTVYSVTVALRSGPWHRFSTADLAWIEDRFEWCAGAADVDLSGAFRIEGLAPKVHRMLAYLGTTQRPNDDTPTLFGRVHSETQRETPSQDGLVLRARDRCVRLDIRSGDRPLVGATVTIGPSGIDLPEHHFVDVHWSVDSTAAITVSKEGFAPCDFVIEPEDPLPSAVRVVELASDASLASLSLLPILTCEAGGTYAVQLVPLQGAGVDLLAMNHIFDSRMNKNFNSSESSWRFDGISPGRYRIDVCAVPAGTGVLPWCVPSRIEVELKPGESTVRELPFVSGGRIAITVRDEHAVTTTTVFGGEERLLRFTYFDSHTGRTVQGGGSSVTVPIGVRVEVAEPFEPGLLTLTITRDTPDHAKRDRTVNVVPGQLTELVVDFSKPDER